MQYLGEGTPCDVRGGLGVCFDQNGPHVYGGDIGSIVACLLAIMALGMLYLTVTRGGRRRPPWDRR
jgi:hypothetical protein